MQFKTLLLQSTTYSTTKTFKSNQTNKTFKIFHQVKGKSSFVIYLLECYICNIQYVGKSETPLNIRLSNHRKDIKNANAMPACKHFKKRNHEQLRNICATSTETLKERVKLETLALHGLNQDLN